MTKLDAANKALLLLGVAQIVSLTQDVQAARVMNTLFESTRLSVLAEFPWSFALKVVPLESAPEGTDIPIGWEFAWIRPEGAAGLYRVFGQGAPDGNSDYMTANGVIFTRDSDVWAEYTDVLSDVESWPALAAEAFVVRLASNAAPALDGSPQLAASLLAQYAQFSALAKGNSTNDERVPRQKPTHYIDVRRG
jgi:hypothetical protein